MKRCVAWLSAVLLTLAACGGGAATKGTSSPSPGAVLTGEASSITVYSGRGEDLAGPILKEFQQATGIEVKVRYGDTAELAATILEEGGNSPADVFFAQDAGALGAIAAAGRLVRLPDPLLQPVAPAFRSGDGLWVGLSGRARTLVYNTERLKPADLPASVLELTQPRWKGKVGWAPTNGSFQAFVTALRVLSGDDAARKWLRDMKANGAQAYPRNAAIVQAAAAGEIEVGLVNHYYLLQLKAQNPSIAAANHFFKAGDSGALVNVAGVGILNSSRAQKTAGRLVEFLLSEPAQRYFASKTYEYPLVGQMPADPALPPLEALRPPSIDLSKLADLQGTLSMLKEEGVV